MNTLQSIPAFVVAASLLTITPGLDTALVLRTSTAEGPREGVHAAIGINLGCLIWGAGVALGLAGLLEASHLAYSALKWVGAAYLICLGANLILRPRSEWTAAAASPDARPPRLGWFWKGLLGNLLNPKVGIFYVSFLPQFVPPGAAVAPYTFMLASIHVALGLIWCSVLVLASQPLGRALRRPATLRILDRLTGLVFVGFGARLALAER